MFVVTAVYGIVMLIIRIVKLIKKLGKAYKYRRHKIEEQKLTSQTTDLDHTQDEETKA